MMTMSQAVRAYRDGNNRGEGYAPYADVPGEDTVEAAVSAAQADGWTLVMGRRTSDEVAVLSSDEGEIMAIGGDATGRGAWAVIIVSSVPRSAIEALRAEARAAGDETMVTECDRALRGESLAWAECATVIAEARAQS